MIPASPRSLRGRGRGPIPSHTGPTDGAGPDTHRQAASREGCWWVHRPPFAHGLPSRQGGAVWGQKKVGRSDRHTEPQIIRTDPPLLSARQQLHQARRISVWVLRGPLSTVPTAPHPSPSCWGCSCPCQLKPWEPQGRGEKEELTCARCVGSGSCLD